MNAPDINRSTPACRLRRLSKSIRSSVAGWYDGAVPRLCSIKTALDVRAEKKPGLDLLGLSQAELDLSELLGRAVGIVLVSGLEGREAAACPCIVAPA